MLSLKANFIEPAFSNLNRFTPIGASRAFCENVVLRGIFKTAVRKGYLAEAQLPCIKPKTANNAKKQRRRPAFTRDEYQRLYRFMRGWVCEGRNQDRRLLLRDYVLILMGSGMRPGTETDALKWQDVELDYVDGDGNRHVRLWVKGKTGKRELIAMPNTRAYLKRIQERRRVVLGADPPLDEFVFALPDGTAVKEDSMRQLFTKLLKAADLLTDRRGDRRVLYSLRHTYATFRLVYGKVSVYALKENMGTSVQMIEKHYGHLKPSMAAAELTKT